MSVTIGAPRMLREKVQEASLDGAFVHGNFQVNEGRTGFEAKDTATAGRVDNIRGVLANRLSETSWFRQPVDIIQHFLDKGFSIDPSARKFTEDGDSILKITKLVIHPSRIQAFAKPIELSETIATTTIEELKDIQSKVSGDIVMRVGGGGGGSESDEDDDDDEYEANLRDLIHSAKARAVIARMEARRLEAQYNELYGDQSGSESDDDGEGSEDGGEGGEGGEDESEDEEDEEEEDGAEGTLGELDLDNLEKLE